MSTELEGPKDAALEPAGGNLYEPHMLQVNSGTFWRCEHGLTGFGKGMKWIGCEECRKGNPAKAKAWEDLAK